MIPEKDVLELFLSENVSIDQIETVLDDSLAQLVVAALIALNDVHHELHHILLDARILALHSIYFLHALLNLAHNELACVSIDKDHPFVDEELFGLELDLDSFKHLNCLDYDRKGSLGHSCIIFLEQKKVHL